MTTSPASITTAELKTMWSPEAQGRITKWNQIRSSWPDRELRLFGAGVDSGTFDYFTEAINGKEKASRGDFASSEDDNVIVQGVASDELALGFLPLAYVEQNKARLKLVPVDDGKTDNGATNGMTVRAGHPPPYAVIAVPVKPEAGKTCDPARKQAKVVNPPNLLKMGVNSPVTTQIYA